MQSTNLVKIGAALAALVLFGVGWQTRETWKGWVLPSKDAGAEPKQAAAIDHPERVKLKIGRASCRERV